jgi:hypothetical protein
MNLKELLAEEQFELLSGTTTDKEILNTRCCDLLSWVMARGSEGTAWVTVQAHSNIVAVASLLEFACIIIPENITVEKDVLDKAHDEDVAIVSTPLDSYGVFKYFYEKGLK